jgi:hypothetical protein
LVSFYSSAQKYSFLILRIPFDSTAVPAPDYSRDDSWAARPDMKDNADRVPSGSDLKDEQANAGVDVFFIHPTTYVKQNRVSRQWNADVQDQKINKWTDKSTILYQASVFNGAGRIYAPRYRQAHIGAYFTKDKELAGKVFSLAYSDVSRSFQFYLDHYNQGRPIIIASHSQGTTHAIRLLKEYFDGKPLMKQLVAAYLIGMPVHDSAYAALKPCDAPDETGCLISWQTFARNYYPVDYVLPIKNSLCTNPLLWTTDTLYAPNNLNKGGILKNFNKVIKGLADAQVKNGLLHVSKPHFFGNFIFDNFLFRLKNYHAVDYNLFYINIRENAQLRTKKFLDKNKK